MEEMMRFWKSRTQRQAEADAAATDRQLTETRRQELAAAAQQDLRDMLRVYIGRAQDSGERFLLIRERQLYKAFFISWDQQLEAIVEVANEGMVEHISFPQPKDDWERAVVFEIR